MRTFPLLIAATLASALAAPALATSPARTRLLTWPNPSKAGKAVQMRAEVDGLGGGAPKGNLRFADGFTALGVAALSPYGAGQATLAAGYDHSCALTSAGGAACWGANSEGGLGDGTTTNRSAPLGVRGLASGVVAIAAGHYHSCALTGAGAVLCWGSDMYGQLGDGTDVLRRTTPVAASGLSSGVVAIATGGAHSCALTSAGAVKCWGWNLYGQVGDGSFGYRLAPIPVSGLASGVVAITAGRSHSCALTSAGAVKCWGWNVEGQIGDGTWNNYRLTPTAVSGLSSGVVAITAGERHSCALTSAGAVACWGSNAAGQLGDGTTTIRLTPVSVRGLSSDVVAITAGAMSTCALTSAGAVKCWGYNSDGELGDGTTTTHLTPVPVSGLSSGVVAMATGGYHSCAATAAGVLKCWGANFSGQLGDGTTTRRLIPTVIRGSTTLVRSRASISSGALGAGSHTLRAGFRGDIRHSSSIGTVVQTVE